VFGVGAAPRDLTLVGWRFEPQPPVNVNGKKPEQRCVDLFIVHYPSLLSSAGSAAVTFGSISTTYGPMSNPTAGSLSQPSYSGSSWLTLAAGREEIFHMTMPFIGKTVKLNSPQFTLTAQTQANMQIAVSAYDRAAGKWVSVAPKRAVATGGSVWAQSLPGADARRWLSPDGLISIRIKVLGPPGRSLQVSGVSVTISGVTR